MRALGAYTPISNDSRDDLGPASLEKSNLTAKWTLSARKRGFFNQSNSAKGEQ
jgi:hypothetical protein